MYETLILPWTYTLQGRTPFVYEVVVLSALEILYGIIIIPHAYLGVSELCNFSVSRFNNGIWSFCKFYVWNVKITGGKKKRTSEHYIRSDIDKDIFWDRKSTEAVSKNISTQ